LSSRAYLGVPRELPIRDSRTMQGERGRNVFQLRREPAIRTRAPVAKSSKHNAFLAQPLQPRNGLTQRSIKRARDLDLADEIASYDQNFVHLLRSK